MIESVCEPRAAPSLREGRRGAPAPRCRQGAARLLGVPSIGEILESRDGYGPGFDFLRLALAISVIGFHTHLITHGAGLTFDRYVWLFSFSVLPMFFALGGFLISASAERIPLKHFLLNRAFRIFPALAVETALSAFVLGILLTASPARDYFGDKDFFQYLLNIAGWVQFDLPGLFEANPLKGVVNGSLWTLPQELAGYLVIPVLVVFGLFRPRGVLAVGLALLVVDAALQMGDATSGWENGLVFFGTRLIAGFCFGCAIYKYRHSVPCHWAIAAGILALLAVTSLVGAPHWRFLVWVRELSVPPVAYLIVLLGMLPMPSLPFFSKGDYSYGLYLYAFPIQQSVTQLLPRMNSDGLHFAISLVLTTAFAVFSWHVVEKPVLRLRRRFSFVANRREAAASLLTIP